MKKFEANINYVAVLYSTLREVSYLTKNTMENKERKQTVLDSLIKMKNIADEMITRAKLRKLRQVFNFRDAMKKTMDKNAPERLLRAGQFSGTLAADGLLR